MSFSNFLENKVLDHVFGGNAYTAPATLYVGLHTSNPNEDNSGTEISTSGTAYIRKAVAFTVTGATADNDAAVEFDTATASWGTITHCGIYDAESGGNLLAYAELATSKVIDSGDVFRIPAADLDISLD